LVLAPLLLLLLGQPQLWGLLLLLGRARLVLLLQVLLGRLWLVLLRRPWPGLLLPGGPGLLLFLLLVQGRLLCCLLLLLLLQRRQLPVVVQPQLEEQGLANDKCFSFGKVEGLAAGVTEHLQAGQQLRQLGPGLQEHLNIISKLAPRQALAPHEDTKPFCPQVLHQCLPHKQVQLGGERAALPHPSCKLHHG
jgi:hypothetical protein